MTENSNDHILIDINAEVTAKIDVLVEKEFYPNRADFIEKAIQNQLNLHDATFQELVKTKNVIIGWANYSAKELEAVAAKGKKLEIKVLGGLSFSEDVTPELVDRAIAKINLAGILKASKEILPAINARRFTILGNKYDEFKRLPTGEDDNKDK
ncbi:MAG: CopG family transcriptional regulator [Promethearchaeota archaeon]